MSANRHTGGRSMHVLEGPWRILPLVLTMTGPLTITNKFPVALVLDPGGAARNILMPAPEEGLMFLLINTADAAETITVRNAADSATYGTVAQNARSFLYSDGVTWYLI